MLDAFLDAPHLLSPDLVSTKQSAKFAYLEIWNYVDVSSLESTHYNHLRALDKLIPASLPGAALIPRHYNH